MAIVIIKLVMTCFKAQEIRELLKVTENIRHLYVIPKPRQFHSRGLSACKGRHHSSRRAERPGFHELWQDKVRAGYHYKVCEYVDVL